MTLACAISILAKALFSCNAAHAVFPSLDTVIYSGSKSCAAVAFGPKIRIPLFLNCCSWPLNALKSAVLTLGRLRS